MVLVPKIFHVLESFPSGGHQTDVVTIVDLSGSSGILGALAVGPTDPSSSAVSLSSLQLVVDGSMILDLSDQAALQALQNLLREANRMIFRIPFRTSLRLKAKFSRQSTSGPPKAAAMALVLVEE